MFSGIIEAKSSVLQSHSVNETFVIVVSRPPHFDDLQIGDSVAVNGVCLTVEAFDSSTVQFTLGLETLQVLGPYRTTWLDRSLNLERSLKFGDRVHGHLVTGHVEVLVPVVRSEPLGDNWLMAVEVDPSYAAYCWKKGSVTLNGVSLTINSCLPVKSPLPVKGSFSVPDRVADPASGTSQPLTEEPLKKGGAVRSGDARAKKVLEVCLIPETQRQTNLASYGVGDFVCFEPDSFAKSVSHAVNEALKAGGINDV